MLMFGYIRSHSANSHHYKYEIDRDWLCIFRTVVTISYLKNKKKSAALAVGCSKFNPDTNMIETRMTMLVGAQNLSVVNTSSG